jgi:hypothetical protein
MEPRKNKKIKIYYSSLYEIDIKQEQQEDEEMELIRMKKMMIDNY